METWSLKFMKENTVVCCFIQENISDHLEVILYKYGYVLLDTKENIKIFQEFGEELCPFSSNFAFHF